MSEREAGLPRGRNRAERWVLYVGRWSRGRGAAIAIGFSLVAAACSSAELTSTSPDRDQVVSAYVDTGLSEAVASCVVGMGERQFDLADLDPSQPTPRATQQLVDEFILSCVEASQLRDTGSLRCAGPHQRDAGAPFQFSQTMGMRCSLWSP